MRTFKTVEEAKNAGWYHINANAVITEHENTIGSRRLVCRDVSDGCSFGYDFTIVVQEMKKCPVTGLKDWYYVENEKDISSQTIVLMREKNQVNRPGCFSARFQMAEIEELARLCLPHDAEFRMFNFK